MVVLEAQRLSGIDRKKHVRFVGNAPRSLVFEGELVKVKHLGDGGTTIVIQTVDGRLEYEHVPADRHVEITGVPSA